MATLPSSLDFTVGWICILHTEFAAAQKMLDTKYKNQFGDWHDHNIYSLGQIGPHNIVIACLPMGWKGSNPAAIVATRMMIKFPNIKVGLLVGIGGGLSQEGNDIRLGDVVVSKPEGQYGGVVQYDLGKWTTNGFKCTGSLNAPPERLLAVLNFMPPHGTRFTERLSGKYPSESDLLYKPDYDHVSGNTCNQCDETQRVERDPENRQGGPHIFYGTIASGNSVIKDSTVRDILIAKHGVLCFEMEAAGLMNSSFPCLTIRGISDYADSHKNDKWQNYAAATAAQFAKDFLEKLPEERMRNFDSVRELCDSNVNKFDRNMQHQIDGCLDSLLLEDSKNRMENGRKAGATTCEWIKTHTKFEGWMRASRSTILLVSGKPGCSKSVLAEYVRTYLAQNLGAGVLASFFNDRGKGNEQVTPGILRAVLYQIFKNSPSIIHQSRLMEEYMKLKGSKTDWPLNVLKSLFLSLRAPIDGFTFYLIIDSLDEPECNEITNLLLQITRNNFCKSKVFLTSRSSSETFLHEFSDNQYPRIFLESEDSKHIRDDIEKYVSYRMEYLGGGLTDPRVTKDLQAIISEVINQSNDVFLCVDLLVRRVEEELNHGIPFPDLVQSLKERADEMTEMGELYQEILKRLPDQHTKDRRIMLQWVLFAERPLKEEEFRIAVIVSQNPNKYDFEDKLLKTVSLKTFKRQVNSHCGGLVEITEQQIEGRPERVVQLIHHSANGYLRNWLLKENTSQASVQYELAMTCLNYLRLHKAATGDTIRSTRYERLVQTHHFLQYAALYWSKHLDMAERFEDFKAIMPESSLPIQLSRFERHLDYSPEVQLLHIISELGHKNVVELLLQNDAEVDAKDNHGRTPLYLAAREGHGAVVDILKVWGANKEATNDRDQTLLHQAANEGIRKGVDQLIRIGANVNAIDQDGLTPLYIAAEMDHGSIVYLLVNKRAEIELMLLHKAVERRSKIAAELLIAVGANIDARDCSGRTPLHEAVNQTRDNVGMLIYNGAALDVTDNEGKTPLHTVIGSRDDATDIVELLVESGASTTTRDKNRETLLHAAGSKGSIHSVNILLKHKGLGKNARDRNGRTPLHLAASKGRLGVVELLVIRGANMEAKDKDGRTTLHTAVISGKVEIVRLLVLKGANKSAVDFNLQTPLHLATSLDHNDTISILLDDKVAPSLLLHSAMGRLHAYTFIENSAYFKNLNSWGRQMEAQKAVDNAKRVAFEWPVDPDHIPGLIKLALYDIVILCDDSGSMNKWGRKALLKETLTRIAEFATMLSSTGISLRFPNDSCKGHSLDHLTTDNINEVMDKIVCYGRTKLGTMLDKKIVQPMVIQRMEKREKPLIVMIITDEMPYGEGENTLQKTILSCKNQGYDNELVIFLISQIGDDKGATKFLKDLESDNEIKDMVFCSEKLDDLKELALKNRRWSNVDRKYTALLIELFSNALTERTT